MQLIQPQISLCYLIALQIAWGRPIDPNTPNPPEVPSVPTDPKIIDVYEKPEKQITNENVIDLDSDKYVLVPKDTAKELEHGHRESRHDDDDAPRIIIETSSDDDDDDDDDDDESHRRSHHHHHSHESNPEYHCNPFGYGDSPPCRPYPVMGVSASPIAQAAQAAPINSLPMFVQTINMPPETLQTTVSQPQHANQQQVVTQPQLVTLGTPGTQMVIPNTLAQPQAQKIVSMVPGPLTPVV